MVMSSLLGQYGTSEPYLGMAMSTRCHHGSLGFELTDVDFVVVGGRMA